MSAVIEGSSAVLASRQRYSHVVLLLHMYHSSPDLVLENDTDYYAKITLASTCALKTKPSKSLLNGSILKLCTVLCLPFRSELILNGVRKTHSHHVTLVLKGCYLLLLTRGGRVAGQLHASIEFVDFDGIPTDQIRPQAFPHAALVAESLDKKLDEDCETDAGESPVRLASVTSSLRVHEPQATESDSEDESEFHKLLVTASSKSFELDSDLNTSSENELGNMKHECGPPEPESTHQKSSVKSHDFRTFEESECNDNVPRYASMPLEDKQSEPATTIDTFPVDAFVQPVLMTPDTNLVTPDTAIQPLDMGEIARNSSSSSLSGMTGHTLSGSEEDLKSYLSSGTKKKLQCIRHDSSWSSIAEICCVNQSFQQASVDSSTSPPEPSGGVSKTNPQENSGSSPSTSRFVINEDLQNVDKALFLNNLNLVWPDIQTALAVSARGLRICDQKNMALSMVEANIFKSHQDIAIVDQDQSSAKRDQEVQTTHSSSLCASNIGIVEADRQDYSEFDTHEKYAQPKDSCDVGIVLDGEDLVNPIITVQEDEDTSSYDSEQDNAPLKGSSSYIRANTYAPISTAKSTNPVNSQTAKLLSTMLKTRQVILRDWDCDKLRCSASNKEECKKALRRMLMDRIVFKPSKTIEGQPVDKQQIGKVLSKLLVKRQISRILADRAVFPTRVTKTDKITPEAKKVVEDILTTHLGSLTASHSLPQSEFEQSGESEEQCSDEPNVCDKVMTVGMLTSAIVPLQEHPNCDSDLESPRNASQQVADVLRYEPTGNSDDKVANSIPSKEHVQVKLAGVDISNLPFVSSTAKSHSARSHSATRPLSAILHDDGDSSFSRLQRCKSQPVGTVDEAWPDDIAVMPTLHSPTSSATLHAIAEDDDCNMHSGLQEGAGTYSNQYSESDSSSYAQEEFTIDYTASDCSSKSLVSDSQSLGSQNERSTEEEEGPQHATADLINNSLIMSPTTGSARVSAVSGATTFTEELKDDAEANVTAWIGQALSPSELQAINLTYSMSIAETARESIMYNAIQVATEDHNNESSLRSMNAVLERAEREHDSMEMPMETEQELTSNTARSNKKAVHTPTVSFSAVIAEDFSYTQNTSNDANMLQLCGSQRGRTNSALSDASLPSLHRQDPLQRMQAVRTSDYPIHEWISGGEMEHMRVVSSSTIISGTGSGADGARLRTYSDYCETFDLPPVCSCDMSTEYGVSRDYKSEEFSPKLEPPPSKEETCEEVREVEVAQVEKQDSSSEDVRDHSLDNSSDVSERYAPSLFLQSIKVLPYSEEWAANPSSSQMTELELNSRPTHSKLMRLFRRKYGH